MNDFQRMTADPQPFDGDVMRRAIDEHNVCVRRWNRLTESQRAMTTFHGVDAHIRVEKGRDRHDDYG